MNTLSYQSWKLLRYGQWFLNSSRRILFQERDFYAIPWFLTRLLFRILFRYLARILFRKECSLCYLFFITEASMTSKERFYRSRTRIDPRLHLRLLGSFKLPRKHFTHQKQNMSVLRGLSPVISYCLNNGSPIYFYLFIYYLTVVHFGNLEICVASHILNVRKFIF